MARTKFSRKAEGWLEKARCASVGLLGLGLLVATFFGASDRLAMAGVLPPFVPGEAVDIDRPDQIAASARAALNRDPVNQRLLGLWGSAELARGEDARAEAIFRVAGGLGWRDRPTQLYWYAVARDGGDFVVAASRLDALLRTGANEFLPELRELESVSAGRAAIAERLSESPPWLRRYVLELPELDDVQAGHRLDIVTSGDLIDRALAEELAGRLFRQGKARAAMLISTSAGDGAANARYLAFAPPAQAPSVFDWKLSSGADISVRVEEGARGTVLRATSYSVRAAMAARRGMALMPGRYSLSWAYPEEAPEEAEMAVRCADNNRTLAARGEQRVRSRTARSVAFTIPSDDTCQGQWLEIWIPSSPFGGERAFSIEGVAVVPVS